MYFNLSIPYIGEISTANSKKKSANSKKKISP